MKLKSILLCAASAAVMVSCEEAKKTVSDTAEKTTVAAEKSVNTKTEVIVTDTAAPAATAATAATANIAKSAATDAVNSVTKATKDTVDSTTESAKKSVDDAVKKAAGSPIPVK